MLQKKPPVKPEHTERTGFEGAIRSRKAALGQRCAAGVPEMNAVDGFPARDMGMPAQDHIAGAHAGNGGATGKVVSVLCHDAQSVSGYHGAVFHRERKQHRSTSASQLPRTATMGVSKSAKTETTLGGP